MVENTFRTYGSSSVHLGSQVILDYKKDPLDNDFLSGEIRHYREMDNSKLVLSDDQNYRLEKINQILTTIFGALGTSEAFNSGFFNYRTSIYLGLAGHALIGLIFSDMRNRALTIVKTLRKS